MLLSFIIPLFNNEKYVLDCINSILNLSQYFEDYEIIVINDGSTDNSLAIVCSNYKGSSKVKIIDKANEGVGPTRNLGVQLAKGKYLSFIDSDDCINAADFYKVLQEVISNDLDVIMTNQAILIDINNEFIRDDKYSILGKSIIRDDLKVYRGIDFFSESTFNDGIVNTLTRKDLWVKHQIVFERYTHLEDLQIMFQLIYYAKRFKATNISFYYCRLTPNSATRHNNHNKNINAIKSMRKVLSYLKNFTLNDSLNLHAKKKLEQKIQNHTLTLLILLLKIDINQEVAKEYLDHLRIMGLYPIKYNFYKAMPIKIRIAYYIKYNEYFFIKKFRKVVPDSNLTFKDLI